MSTIANNVVVAMRYIMRNAAGEELENTMKSMPVSYLHGGTGIHTILQQQLQGLRAGDKKMVFLYKDTGTTSEDFNFEVIIDEVREALPAEILLGYPVQAEVQRCEADCSCYEQSGT